MSFLTITGPHKIAELEDDIFTVWEKTKTAMNMLGREEEAVEFEDEIEDMSEEEAEDFFEEQILPFMNDIAPDDLVFGINKDDEIGFWYEEDIAQEDEYEEEPVEFSEEITKPDIPTEIEKVKAEIVEDKDVPDNLKDNPESNDDIIRVCMKCKKILGGTSKKTYEELTDKEKKRVSHGLCEECLEKYYPDE